MRVWIGIAGLAGLSAVAMGAFAAHGLKHVLALEQLQTLQIGVQYQLWHAGAAVGGRAGATAAFPLATGGLLGLCAGDAAVFR